MPAVTPVLYLVGAIAPQNPSAATFLDAVRTLPPAAIVVAQGLPVYIESGGGMVDMALQIGVHLSKLRPVCYVKEAQSAALQIVMPACAKVVLLDRVRGASATAPSPLSPQPAGTREPRRSMLGFHSAAWCVGPRLFDATDAILHFRKSLEVAGVMGALFENTFGPTTGCAQGAFKAYPEAADKGCAVTHMVARTEMDGRAFAEAHPHSKIPVVLVPESEFPDVTVELVPVSPGHVNFCEVPT